MKEICGKPMLAWQIERIKRSRLVDRIVIATTDQPADQVIVDLAKQCEVEVFRGPEDDVLGRIAGLIRQFNVELHVELISDSPFTDPHIVDEVIGYYLKHQDEVDYVSNGISLSYPSGMEVNVYPGKILLDAESKVSADDPTREDVDIHISKSGLFRCQNLEAPEWYYYPDIFLEVDTDKDFQMVQQIFEHFHEKGHDHFSLSQILDFLRTRPDLAELNRNEERRWWKNKDKIER